MHHLLTAALARRSPIHSPSTNAFRLVDGEGDDLPGIYLEDFAGRLLLSTTGPPPHPILSWLRNQPASSYAKQLDHHERISPTHIAGPSQDTPFLIRENNLNFEISFQSGYSQGIFLDQRDNRHTLASECTHGMTVLNTFSYTGAFSVAAASVGATTTTLDLSAPYLEWAKRNFQHNALDPANHFFCKGDTFHWLRRFAKQGRKFDRIILDPPTFSRDEKGQVFRAESDFGELAALAAAILNPHGKILCCTNFRGISDNAFEKLIRSRLTGPWRARHTPMPPDFTAPPYLKSIWLES
jgi:23S rRNA (cytosine1962-C5)-methyltransferase